MTDPSLPPAVPAATVVILRDAATGGAPEILMVERTQAMAFAPGALVFPGGRVDAGDRAIASTPGGDADDGAARIAAIRETIEEVGLAIGVDPPLDDDATDRVRAGLAAGATLDTLLPPGALAAAARRLTPFARWRPAHRLPRLFDTRFYLARLPAAAPTPRADGSEIGRLFWASAAATLAMVEAGRATVIFPTRRTLERLARFATIEAAFADAAAHPIETITPWVETRDGVDYACIPEGLGYPITAEAMTTPGRN